MVLTVESLAMYMYAYYEEYHGLTMSEYTCIIAYIVDTDI